MRRQIHILSEPNKEERWEWMGTRLDSEEDSGKILVENGRLYGNKTQRY